MTEVPEIKLVECWTPRAGDVLLVKVDGKPRPEVMQEVQTHMGDILKRAGYSRGQIEIFVYSDMLEFKFIRKEEVQ